MVFTLARTFGQPAKGSNASRGFPAPGAGRQTTGDAIPAPRTSIWQSVRPLKGRATWMDPNNPQDAARGFPAPQGASQARPRNEGVIGASPGVPMPFGAFIVHEHPYYSRGTAAFAPQFGQVSYNPIGAGVVAMNRVQASYGPAAQYENGEIFWTSQAVPTSVNLQGLTDPNVLAAILGPIGVQAAVRVNG